LAYTNDGKIAVLPVKNINNVSCYLHIKVSCSSLQKKKKDPLGSVWYCLLLPELGGRRFIPEKKCQTPLELSGRSSKKIGIASSIKLLEDKIFRKKDQ
jgi:hypothetical protein